MENFTDLDGARSRWKNIKFDGMVSAQVLLKFIMAKSLETTP
jgi:hypothetical protein